MPSIHRLFVALLVTSVASVWFGSTALADVDQAIQQKIVAGLKQWRSDLGYSNFRKTPVPGLYHVQIVGGPVVYVSEDGNYLIEGDLLEVQPGNLVSWREKMLAPLRRDLINQAEVSDMVVFSPTQETKAVVYIFTDIDCGFCRRMHAEVPALNQMGVEVRYLAFPRAGLGTNSSSKLESVWCADDRQAAMDTIKAGKEIPQKSCDTTALEDHMKLVRQMDINATPVIILTDGTLVSGYRRAGQLKQILGI